MFNKFKKPIRDKIDDFVGIDGSLDGSAIQKEWFGDDIKADVFLSHSHKDEHLAINFAGFLYREYGLITFIDSCVWGYANDLLKKIDKEYCWKEKTNTYDYDKRNFSTSHVHMMLSTALYKMIDKSECIIFLNTENSTTTTEDVIKDSTVQKTYSPWIYSEINCINLIQKKDLERQIEKKSMQHGLFENASLSVKYDIDKELTNLTILDEDIFVAWRDKNDQLMSRETDALDNLYTLCNKA